MVGVGVSDEAKNKLGGVAATFTKTDRILSGRDKVAVSMDYNASESAPPAWSNGEAITFNVSRFAEHLKDPKVLATLLGLNYHETAHVMFSPRDSETVVREIRAAGTFQAWNILEDQRIEALFTAQFGSASKFFAAMVMRFIVSNKSGWDTAHLLVHGRRYLPLEIRAGLRNRFKGTLAQQRRAEDIIDEFRKLDPINSSTDAARTVELVQQFHDLIAELGGASSQCQVGKGEGFGKGTPDKRNLRKATERRAEKDEQQEAAEEDGEDGSEFYPESEAPEEGDDDRRDEEDGDDGSDDEPQGDSGVGVDDPEDGEDDAADEDSADEWSDDGDDWDDEDGDDDEAPSSSGRGGRDDFSDEDEDEAPEGDGPSDGLPLQGDGDDAGGDAGGDADPSEVPEDGDGNGRGAGPGGVGDGEDGDVSPGELDDEIAAAIENALNHIDTSADVQNEITRLNQAMNDADAPDLILPQISMRSLPVSAEMVQSASRVETELRRLQEDLEAGWDYGSDFGRLNVSRVLGGGDRDSWFDTWEEGHEQDSGIEAMFLIDVSGSMRTLKSGYSYGNSRDKYTPRLDQDTKEPVHDLLTPACMALWVLKRAMDRLDAVTSALSFGSSCHTMYHRGEQVPASEFHNLPCEGGTDPQDALKEARRILGVSEKPNKILFVIGDGDFNSQGTSWNPYTGETYLDVLKSTRAVKVFIGINTNLPQQYVPGFDVISRISHPDQIKNVAQQVVENILRNAAMA